MATEVALIPPISLLETTIGRKYQLMLPDLLKDTQYKYIYGKFCADPDYHVIMDNGAAEAIPIGDMALFDLAMNYLPDEIVLPDVLGARRNTVERSLEFMRQYRRGLNDAAIVPGYVAQGVSVEDAFVGVVDFFSHPEASTCGVVYVPRLLSVPGSLDARLELAAQLDEYFDDMVDIHFLGASKYWPKELTFASGRGHIRSIDTSMPYNYSYHVKSFFGNKETDPIERSKDYFDQPAEMFPNVEIRIGEYLRWGQ